jgi:AcrR family transcriptional regulator
MPESPIAAAKDLLVGRPRCRALDQRIIDVTLDLLATMAFDQVTIAEIAARSGCPKSSVYRRHADVRALAVAAMEQETAPELFPIADQGSLAADLACFIDTVADAMSDRRARILASLLFAMRDDPALAAPMMQRLADLHRRGWRPILARAIARGELRPEALPANLLGDVTSALIFQRIMVQHLPVTRSFLTEVHDMIVLPSLAPFRAAPPGSD